MSGSDSFTIYAGVKWTLTATANTSPRKQTLTVMLDEQPLCVFEGSGGRPMTIKDPTREYQTVAMALKSRLISWSLETETSTTSLAKVVSHAGAGTITSGPLHAKPEPQMASNNPFIIDLPAKTEAQLTAICMSSMEQQFIEVGVITEPTDLFAGSQRDSAMKLPTGGQSTTVGPFDEPTKIVAFFTYKNPLRSLGGLGPSDVGRSITSGNSISLTTIPARNPMLINSFPPWCPLPGPFPKDYDAVGYTPGACPVGEFTAGNYADQQGHATQDPPAGGDGVVADYQHKSWWWYPNNRFNDIGSLLNIATLPQT
jgi:hypothetical protein